MVRVGLKCKAMVRVRVRVRVMVRVGVRLWGDYFLRLHTPFCIVGLDR